MCEDTPSFEPFQRRLVVRSGQMTRSINGLRMWTFLSHLSRLSPLEIRNRSGVIFRKKVAFHRSERDIEIMSFVFLWWAKKTGEPETLVYENQLVARPK